MQYNAPLDQPSNPNAPYVDGNPAAGIQGSIVPAASLEFDQREVVEVITRANVRGYSDFTNIPCAVPANTDMTQLRKAIEGYITNWQFLITSYVTFTVHGSGADFPDLIAAFAYLSKYKITSTGHVTLQLAGAASGIAVKYTYSQTIIIDHPNNNRISLLGAPMLHTLSPTDSGYSWTGPSAAQRAADTANNLTLLRGSFATELYFVNATGFSIQGNMLADFDGILITSDGSNAGSNGVTFSCRGFFNSSLTRPMMGMGAVGFGGHGFLWDNGSATSNYAAGSNSSPVANATWVSCGNGYSGFCLGNGSFHCTVHNLIALGNASIGFLVFPRAGCQIDAALFANANANYGVFALTTAACYLGAASWGGASYQSHVYRNGYYGIYAEEANVEFTGDFGASGYGNGSLQASALRGSTIAIFSSTNIGSCSPALNTVGNSNSMITNT